MGLPIIEVLCTSIDLSFCHKRRVDYYKTTARFDENISSFWEKQRIVLVKTTYRFEENNVLFLNNIRMQNKQSMSHPSKTEFFEL